MPRLADVVAVTERLWPLSGAEAWDAPGFLAGDPAAEVTRIHLAVDPTLAVVDETLELGAELLIAHHPLLLRGVTSVAEDRAKGAVIGRLLRGGSALLAAHTNADVVAAGTSAVLADRLGLVDARPLSPLADAPDLGLGRVGRLAAPTTLGRLARAVAAVLPATAGGVRVAGDWEQPIATVAVCAGAGDSLLAHPDVVAADAYVTSDLRHHPASEAREAALLAAENRSAQSRDGRTRDAPARADEARGDLYATPALVDTSHWASEWLWLDAAAAQLREALPEVTVTVSELRTDPWDFAVAQLGDRPTDAPEGET
ncbi:MAG: Nif3-like dinuclear metal center hexameric protein [Actinomycetales bacterium]|nr:Nif3-like dinuclear metal center hexameric protein [Actinomycetales bacterium]